MDDKAGNAVKGISGLDVGLSLVVAVLLCGAAGFFADRWLGSLPWGMLAGIFLGFGAWFVRLAKR